MSLSLFLFFFFGSEGNKTIQYKTNNNTKKDKCFK